MIEMMDEATQQKTPIAFLSYARESPAHIEWVRNLAEQLRARQIDSRLDQWHLKLGDDLLRFMTKGIDGSDFVLIVCSPQYAAKANGDFGGVGFEGSVIGGSFLITGQHNDHNKFIPLLRSGTAAESIPAFLRSRLWVDFTRDADFNTSIDLLVRHVHGRPAFLPPPIIAQNVNFNSLNIEPRANLKSRPVRWIIVAGTGNVDVLPGDLEGVCAVIGKELARRSYGLVTGGWPGADRIVSEHFAEELRFLSLPLENFITQVVEQSWNPAFRAGRIVPVPQGEAEYIESIKRADAAILVGGLGGTWQIGEFMRIAGKPVFPIVSSKGDASRFFKHMCGNGTRDVSLM